MPGGDFLHFEAFNVVAFKHSPVVWPAFVKDSPGINSGQVEPWRRYQFREALCLGFTSQIRPVDVDGNAIGPSQNKTRISKLG
jgi:hypothetical protein